MRTPLIRPLLGVMLTAFFSGAAAQVVTQVASGPANELIPVIGPAAMARGPTGSLYIVSSTSKNLVRLDADGTRTELVSHLDHPFLDDPRGVAVDADGAVYVASRFPAGCLRVTPDGDLTVILGSAGDGVSSLSGAEAVIVDAAGNVIVAGRWSNNVFRVAPTGHITELISVTGDGLGNSLKSPRDLVLDSAGNLYVAGGFGALVFRVTPAGVVSVVMDGAGDGLGNALEIPSALAIDASDTLFVLDSELLSSDSRLFRRSAGGAITMLMDESGDGAGHVFEYGTDVEVDALGNVFVGAQKTQDNVFRISPAGAIDVVLDASTGCSGTGFLSPDFFLVDAQGSLYLAGVSTDNVIRLDPSGSHEVLLDDSTAFHVEDVAVDAEGRVYALGLESLGRVDLDGTSSQLIDEAGTCAQSSGGLVADVVADPQGCVHVTFPLSDVVLTISPDGTLTPFTPSDGVGHVVEQPGPLAVGPDGSLYVAGIESDDVYRVTPAGVVTQVVNRGGDGMGGDLDEPTAVVVDDAGNLYVAARGSQNVLHRDPSGTVTQILSGFPHPCSLAVDAAGNLFVGLHDTQAVLRRTPLGVVSTVLDVTGDGVTALGRPCSLSTDAAGHLYVAGQIPVAVFRVEPGGAVSTILDQSGDGIGHGVSQATSVATDRLGNVYVGGRNTGLFRVADEDAWTNLGGSSPGAGGRPSLSVAGSLLPASPLDVTLLDAAPSAPMLTWISFSSTPLVALGGTVHAFPQNVQLIFLSGASGALSLSTSWPPGIPSGVDLWLQFLVQDTSVPDGIILSNAVSATSR